MEAKSSDIEAQVQTRHETRHEPDTTWRSGCIEVDKEFVQYLGRLSVAVAVLVFSFVQLTQPGVDEAYYSSTVSLILGTFLGSTASGGSSKRKNDA